MAYNKQVKLIASMFHDEIKCNASPSFGIDFSTTLLILALHYSLFSMNAYIGASKHLFYDSAEVKSWQIHLM